MNEIKRNDNDEMKKGPKDALENTDTTHVPFMINEQYRGLLKHFTKGANKEGIEPVVNMDSKNVNNQHWIVDSGAT